MLLEFRCLLALEEILILQLAKQVSVQAMARDGSNNHFKLNAEIFHQCFSTLYVCTKLFEVSLVVKSGVKGELEQDILKQLLVGVLNVPHNEDKTEV